MKDACACPSDLERLIDRQVIVIVVAGQGVDSGTVRFQVLGFHPLLRVMVYVYFQVFTGTPGGASTWTGTALKRDMKGQQRNLQAIFTARSLYDGHEVSSGADGIEYTCTIVGQATQTVSGNWIAEVVAMPEHPMDQDLFNRLCSRLKLVVSPTPPTLTATIP